MRTLRSISLCIEKGSEGLAHDGRPVRPLLPFSDYQMVREAVQPFQEVQRHPDIDNGMWRSLWPSYGPFFCLRHNSPSLTAEIEASR